MTSPSEPADGFGFTTEHDGSLSLEAAVFQAVGAASVCWESMEGTGVFQDDRARAIAEALLVLIAQRQADAVDTARLRGYQQGCSTAARTLRALPPVAAEALRDRLEMVTRHLETEAHG